MIDYRPLVFFLFFEVALDILVYLYRRVLRYSRARINQAVNS